MLTVSRSSRLVTSSSASTSSSSAAACLAYSTSHVRRANTKHALTHRTPSSSTPRSLLSPSYLPPCRSYLTRVSSHPRPSPFVPAAGALRFFSSSQRSAPLVAASERESALEPDFLPLGQLPKSSNMLVIPVARPVMPGLAFDIDMRFYPASTRVAIFNAIAAGQPYVTMSLLQPAARETMMEQARLHWSKEERQLEGLEKPDEPVGGERPDAMQRMFEEKGLNALMEDMAPKKSATGKHVLREPIFPELKDLSAIHSIGVAAEVRIIGAKGDHPRLSGVVHRRVQILEPLPQEESKQMEQLQAIIEKQHRKEREADATAASTTPSNPAPAPLPSLSSLRVRVKHIDDPRLSSQPIDPPTLASVAEGTNAAPTTAESETTAAATDAEVASTSPIAPAADASKSAVDEEMEEKAYVKEINQTISLLSTEESVSRRLKFIASSVRSLSTSASPGRVADLAAHIALATETQLQAVLEAIDVKKRLSETLWLWKKEQEEVRIRKAIQKTVKDKYELLHAKHMLREQKKVIDEMVAAANQAKNKAEEEKARKDGVPPPKASVPKGNDKESLKARFLARIGPGSGRTVPEYAAKVIEEEIAKLSSMDSEASEYQVTRNYVDWLTSIPWGVYAEEKFDIEFAEQILDKEHYGLDDVKQRIYEFIASGMLLKQVPPGKILCLVGPPGVGKTSIGQSISRALGRPFHRISVGGLDDVSELKGHRRTYVGSLPGKLIQALKRVNASNPVLLLDEIDKLSRGGHRGDPAAAMLEVLDPEQNSQFQDHYMEVPVDLSKVLFICTANDRSMIPGPLADRMDFITISGYVQQEKIHIAQNHLIPAVRTKTGVDANSLTLTDDALSHLIRWYCREAGVRGLQKQLEKIFRKVALKIARAQAVDEQTAKEHEDALAQPATKEAEVVSTTTTVTPPMGAVSSLQLPIVVSADNLVEFVGKPLHSSDRMYETNPVGVATGLGTNSLGGWLLYTECTVADQNIHIPPQAITISNQPTGTSKDKAKEADQPPAPSGGRGGELFCTGQLGDVIRESSSIAYTVAKRFVAQYTAPDSIHRDFFAKHRIHLHLPEGATPKDGPSAGIAMVTGLISLALDCAPIEGHAMTGELTLTGLVLPIGGVKEKLMAAKHAGCKLVVLPEENRKDVVELKPFVIEGLDIHFAKSYEDVFRLIFPHFKDQLKQSSSSSSSSKSATAAQAVPVAEQAKVLPIDTPPATKKRSKRTKLPLINPDHAPASQPSVV